MRYLYIIISILLLFGCNYETQYNSTEKSNSPAAEIDTVSEKQKIPLKDSAEIKKIENDPLPFFNIKIKDNSFSIFYNELVKSCLNKDTTAVLSAIYDTLRFSKYECAYGYLQILKAVTGA